MSQQKSELGWTTHSQAIDAPSDDEGPMARKHPRKVDRTQAQEEAFFGAQIRNRNDAGSLAEMLSFKKSYNKHLREFGAMVERLNKFD